MPSTLLLPLPLPADEVKIGSFLVNPSDPTQDYFDPQDFDPGLKPSILRMNVTDFINTIRDAGTKEVEGILTNYFSTTIDWAKSKSLELSSAKAASYLMKNSGYWFERACALTPMRVWFEWVNRRGHKIYLLVGLSTVFDGSFKLEHTASTSTGGRVKVPADVLSGLPPMGLDVGGGGKVSKDQTASSAFSAAGERIWALQYRQIKFKWYSSKKMENAALETGTRWVTFDRSASQVMWSGSRNDSKVVSGSMPVSAPVAMKNSKALLADGIAGKTGYVQRLNRPYRKIHASSKRQSYTTPLEEQVSVRKRTKKTIIKETKGTVPGSQSAGQKRKRIEETPVEDTEDMVEAFMDDDLDLEDQFEVQNTSGERLFIARKVEFGGQPLLPAVNWPKAMLLPSQLRTAVDDLEEEVQPSNDPSIIGRAEHLERLPCINVRGKFSTWREEGLPLLPDS